MSVYVQIPEEGCTYDNVVDTLAANGGKGMKSSDAASLFTKEALNNGIFSLRKPIRLQNNPFPTGEYWRGTETEPCGFSIVGARATSFEELAARYDDDMNGWEYLAPRGDETPSGSIEHFRILDFRGFYPKARPMSLGFSVKTQMYNTENDVLAIIAHNVDEEGRSLTWADFPKLNQYYFGVLMYNDTDACYGVTASTNLAEGGNSVSINPMNIPPRKYITCPFISSQPITWGSGAPDECEMYTIPKEKRIEVTVIESEVSMRVETERVVTSRGIDVNWTIYVTNIRDKELKLTNNYVRIGNKAQEESIDENDREGVIDNTITIDGYATNKVVGSGTVTLDQDFYSMMTPEARAFVELWVLVTLGDGLFRTRQLVLPPIEVTPKIL